VYVASSVVLLAGGPGERDVLTRDRSRVGGDEGWPLYLRRFAELPAHRARPCRPHDRLVSLHVRLDQASEAALEIIRARG
jgi:hypothetical protein